MSTGSPWRPWERYMMPVLTEGDEPEDIAPKVTVRKDVVCSKDVNVRHARGACPFRDEELPTPAVTVQDGKVTILASTYDRIYKLACRAHLLETLAGQVVEAAEAVDKSLSRNEHRKAYRRLMELKDRLDSERQ